MLFAIFWKHKMYGKNEKGHNLLSDVAAASVQQELKMDKK